MSCPCQSVPVNLIHNKQILCTWSSQGRVGPYLQKHPWSFEEWCLLPTCRNHCHSKQSIFVICMFVALSHVSLTLNLFQPETTDPIVKRVFEACEYFKTFINDGHAQSTYTSLQQWHRSNARKGKNLPSAHSYIH
jgi:hypothetical protein